MFERSRRISATLLDITRCVSVDGLLQCCLREITIFSGALRVNKRNLIREFADNGHEVVSLSLSFFCSVPLWNC